MELLFRTVFRQLRHEIHAVLNAELSPNEFMTLRMLKDLGPQKVTDISKRLNVSASHITAVTDLLISKEFVERKRSEQDRRIVEIVLTEAGKEVFERVEQKKQDYFFDRFQHFTDEEIKIIITLFEKINRTKQ
nr:MarR family transcriptional regulator [Metabacillus iocasae]